MIYFSIYYFAYGWVFINIFLYKQTNSKLPPSLDIKNAWYLRKKKVEEDGEWKMYCDDEGRVIAQVTNKVKQFLLQIFICLNSVTL